MPEQPVKTMATRPPVRPIPAYPRIALFGASGFVGQHVRVALHARGAAVVPVATPRLVSPSSHERTQAQLTRSLASVDVVVNAAGVARPGANDDTLWAANADVPKVLAGVCRHLGIRLVHISSAAVLGDTPVLDSRETTHPFSPYSASKSAGERNALQWEGSVVYRPAGVHGMDRPATSALCRLARSPLSSVAEDGSATAPQALAENVADAVAFLAIASDQPPAIVHHPAERLTTADLLTALGGRPPAHIPRKATRGVVWIASWVGRRSARAASIARRLDVLWHGQTIGPSWLESAGWQPPVGPEGWSALGRTLRLQTRRKVVFGVTSGLSAPPFFAGLFTHLVNEGWAVSLVSSVDGHADQFARDEGATFLPVHSVRHPSPWNDCRTMVQVVRHLRREQPRLAVWGTPKMGLLGVVASRLTRTPCIYVIHGLRYHGARGIRRIFLQMMEAVPIALATEVLTVGHDMKACLEADRVARPGKVHVIAQGSANGVLAAPLSSTVEREDQPVSAVFVGRLTQDKGLEEMIRAWEIVRCHAPQATLHLYGRREADAVTGPLAELLGGAEGIIEHGFIENPLPVYDTAQMLLLPTRREGLPTVVLEAAAAGVPTIASDVPGAREPISHGVTGLLVKPQDTEELAHAVLTLGTDPALRRRMGKSAREHVLAKYSRADVHRAWSSLLTSYER